MAVAAALTVSRVVLLRLPMAGLELNIESLSGHRRSGIVGGASRSRADAIMDLGNGELKNKGKRIIKKSSDNEIESVCERERENGKCVND